MFEIRTMETPNQDCIRVIRDSFITVANAMQLTKDNAPTNPAFMEMASLQAMREKGTEMYGAFRQGELVGFVVIEKANDEVYYMKSWPYCLHTGIMAMACA